jgi:hypothetical protein
MQDTGLWGIYFVTDAVNQENMIFNIAEEWMRLCNTVTDFEVWWIVYSVAASNSQLLAGFATLLDPACKKICGTSLTLGYQNTLSARSQKLPQYLCC